MGEDLRMLHKIGKQLFSSTGKRISSHQIMWNKQKLLRSCKSWAKLVKDKDSAFGKILGEYGWNLNSCTQLSKMKDELKLRVCFVTHVQTKNL